MQKSRSLLPLVAVSALLLSACQPGDITGDVTSSSSSEAVTETSSAPYLDGMGSSSSDEPVVIDLSSSAASAAAPASQAAVAPRVITIAVTAWSFSPTTINVKKGEKVQLKLVGGEGIHSFAVPGLNMNVRVEPGQTVIVDLPTDTAGTYEAMCRIPCGAGHKDMKATIVIT